MNIRQYSSLTYPAIRAGRKQVDTGFSCILSSDGRYAAFTHSSLSTLQRNWAKKFSFPFEKRFAPYSDLMPYNAYPGLQDMDNEEAYEDLKKKWARIRALFPQSDEELFGNVTNLVLVDLGHPDLTPTKCRQLVGKFLLAKAREKHSPW